LPIKILFILPSMIITSFRLSSVKHCYYAKSQSRWQYVISPEFRQRVIMHSTIQ